MLTKIQGLDRLVTWADTWGMAFNVSKCHIMHIGPKNPEHTCKMAGAVLGTSDSERDIRVTVDLEYRMASFVLFCLMQDPEYRMASLVLFCSVQDLENTMASFVLFFSVQDLEYRMTSFVLFCSVQDLEYRMASLVLFCSV